MQLLCDTNMYQLQEKTGNENTQDSLSDGEEKT